MAKKAQKRKGKFIVLEGTDGSGKTEQFRRLVRRLRKAGYEVVTRDFPQYQSQSSYFVREYLKGKYGTWREVGPQRASIFYAIDRYDVGLKIKRDLEAGKIVVSNRYVASNFGHQGAKIKETKKRRAFLKWDHEFEYDLLGIPKPDLNIFLRVPAEIANRLIGKRGRRRDVHENIGHLRAAERSYEDAIRLFRRDFRVIECTDRRGNLASIEEIHERVWKAVQSKVFAE